MTESEFITQIQDEITASGALPIVVEEPEIQRIIKQASKWFWENYGAAVETQYYVIPLDQLTNEHFGKHREVQLPDCVISVYECKEIQGAGRIGSMDKDFSFDKLMASEVFLTSYTGDDLVLRTAQMQFYDLAKAFFLETIAYDWNRNTHKLKILGRNPKHDLCLTTYVRIPMDRLYDDYYFLRWCTAETKKSFARMLGTYPFPLPGGVSIDVSTLREEGVSEIQEIKEKIDSENSPDWMLVYHVIGWIVFLCTINI